MKLEEERATISTLKVATTMNRAPVELDQTKQGRLSRMDAIQLKEMAEEQDRRRELRMLRIDSALKRIENCEFGFCVRFKGVIETKRLKFDPSSPVCIQCAQD